MRAGDTDGAECHALLGPEVTAIAMRAMPLYIQK
jgi:hypothetical protein